MTTHSERHNERRKRSAQQLHSSASPAILTSAVVSFRKLRGSGTALLAHTAASLLVPTLYAALPIGLIGGGLYHLLLSENYSPGLPFVVNVAAYALPLLSVSALTAILLRPVFPLHSARSRNQVLTGHDEEVSALAERVAQALGVHYPVSVRVSLEPDLNVMLHGIGQRAGLTLTIGLPLIVYLSPKELTTLLTHTLAPYTSRAGRISHQCVFGINNWLARGLSGEDGWRDAVHDLIYQGKHSAERISGLILQGGLWLSDRLLRLMQLAISPMVRQLQARFERDADRLALEVGGSAIWSETLIKQHKLQLAWQLTLSRISGQRKEHYPDNLAIIACRVVREVGEPGNETRPELALQARIGEAQAAKIESRIAPTLTGNVMSDETINRIGRELSLSLYQEIGVRVSASSLQSVSRRDGFTEQLDTAQDLLEDYTSGAFSCTYVWDTRSSVEIAGMAEDNKIQLAKAAVQRFREHLPDFQEAVSRTHECERQSADAIALVERKKFGYVTDAMYEHYREEFKTSRARLERYRHIIGHQQRCSGTRLAASALLSDEHEELSLALELISVLQALHQAADIVTASRTNLLVLKRLEQKFAEENELELKAPIDRLAANLQNANRRLRDLLKRLPSVIPGIADNASAVSDRLTNTTPEHAGELSRTMAETRALVELYEQMNLLACGELVKIALRSEQKAGIEPVRLIAKTRVA